MLQPNQEEQKIGQNYLTLLYSQVPKVATPLMHVVAAKAIAYQEALKPIEEYQTQVQANAKALANRFLELGYTIVSGGTDNHLILIDLRNKNVTGKVAEEALGLAAITVNKNMVPLIQKVLL